MSTNLVLNVLPRFPAHIRATDGLTIVVENGVDQVIKPDFGALVPVPAVTNPAMTYFQAWDKSINYYQSISFQDFADNLADQVLNDTLVALKDLTMAANQGIYFSSPTVANAYSLSTFVRGISGSADAAAFRTAIGLGSNALSTLSALTLTAGDLLYAGSSNALQRLAVGSAGNFLTVSGGNPAWAELGASIHAATAKTALADADEFSISDSAASNVLKRVTLANLITSIFKTGRTIANAIFEAATFRLKNAGGFSLIFSSTALTADRTITFPDNDIDLSALGLKPLAETTPSTSAIDFTGLPSTLKHIVVAFDEVTTGGSGTILIRLGTSGGFVSTGYTSDTTYSGSFTGQQDTTGFGLNVSTASNTFKGFIHLYKVNSTDWVCGGSLGLGSAGVLHFNNGRLALGGTLTQLRVTSAAAFSFGGPGSKISILGE